jgi:hypothetical protein
MTGRNDFTRTRNTRSVCRNWVALRCAALSALLLLGACTHTAPSRYETGARLSFMDSCMEQLRPAIGSSSKVYMPLGGRLVSTTEYCMHRANEHVRSRNR